MADTAAQPALHRDGQFVIRLPPEQRVNADASTWLAVEEAPVRRRSRKQPAPSHPIPSMQQAFAESLDEVSSGTLGLKPKLRVGDALARRERLLDQDKSHGPPATLWRFRPGQQCHELRKLVAQISFGVYLLLNGMANNNGQVVSILQGHIDEVDEFLEMAMEDFKVTASDLTKRLGLLKLPMDNMAVFERMLENQPFRLQIVEGNLQIEHILSRTNTAHAQLVRDIAEGLHSTQEFAAYLTRQEHGRWRTDRPDVIDIYDAMRGNADGWVNAFLDLQAQRPRLEDLMAQLDATVAEMDKRAGEFGVKPPTVSAAGQPSPQASPVCSPAGSPPPSPPASPGLKIPQSPPRLSLRFSTIPEDHATGHTFLDLPARDSLFGKGLLSPNELSPALTPEIPKQEDEEVPEQSAVPELDSESSRSVSDQESVGCPEEGGCEEGKKESSEEAVEESVEEDAEKPPENDARESSPVSGPLYILQPRTYTPQPPAPLPSPRIAKEFPLENELAAVRSEADDVAQELLPAIREKSQLRQLSPPATEEAPRALRRVSSRIQDEEPRAATRQPSLHIDVEARAARESSLLSGEESQETETLSLQSKQRTSLRQRISLRTNPPDSIQVPPLPSAPELQRPVFASPKTYKNYQTFTGPDSAYASDADRTAVNSSVVEPPAKDFSPPVFPGIVPSPNSDQQYFRPVQASPHSPLQQRPHTAGYGMSRPSHQRNAPSAMGMSMLSSVTTLNADAPKAPPLKKKRSAFGWLKKAFTLDEEERANFDQRKREQNRNLYYDERSPRYLDGKRMK